MLTQMFLKVAFAGSEWVLWVLLLLSFVNVGVIVDRLLYFHRHFIDGDELASVLDQFLRAGDLKQAYATVQTGESIEQVVVAAGLMSFTRGAHACEGAMAAARPSSPAIAVLRSCRMAPMVSFGAEILKDADSTGSSARTSERVKGRAVEPTARKRCPKA